MCLNLDLNRESVSEPRTFSGRLFHSLGARYEKVLPPLVDFAILGYYQESRVLRPKGACWIVA